MGRSDTVHFRAHRRTIRGNIDEHYAIDPSIVCSCDAYLNKIEDFSDWLESITGGFLLAAVMFGF